MTLKLDLPAIQPLDHHEGVTVEITPSWNTLIEEKTEFIEDWSIDSVSLFTGHGEKEIKKLSPKNRERLDRVIAEELRDFPYPEADNDD